MFLYGTTILHHNFMPFLKMTTTVPSMWNLWQCQHTFLTSPTTLPSLPTRQVYLRYSSRFLLPLPVYAQLIDWQRHSNKEVNPVLQLHILYFYFLYIHIFSSQDLGGNNNYLFYCSFLYFLSQNRERFCFYFSSNRLFIYIYIYIYYFIFSFSWVIDSSLLCLLSYCGLTS